MLKLCVICHCIGKPYDMSGIFDGPSINFGFSGYIRTFLIDICPQCENKKCMIPLDSPRAQRIIKENNLEIKEYVRKPLIEKFVWEKDDSEK